MFAYCQNNPVMYVDTSGNRHMMVDLGIVIIEREPELKTAGLSANNASNSSKLVDDIENFDLFNTDENKVMDANYFSAYKEKFSCYVESISWQSTPYNNKIEKYFIEMYESWKEY